MENGRYHITAKNDVISLESERQNNNSMKIDATFNLTSNEHVL